MIKEPIEIIKGDAGQIWIVERPGEANVQLPPTVGYDHDAGADDEVHLRDYWNSIRKHLLLIASVTFIITSLAAFYVQRKPNVYTAQALVQVDLENVNPMLGSSKGGSFIVSPVNDPAYFNTQLRILTSSALLRRVVQRLDLEHNTSFLRSGSDQAPSTWQRVSGLFGIGGKSQRDDVKAQPTDTLTASTTDSSTPTSASEDLDEAKQLAPYVGALRAGLTAEPVKESRLPTKETRLIDISFTHTDPQIAAKVVNGVAETFALSNLEKKTETNTIAGDFLQKRIAELQTQIRSGEERLLNYATNNQILSLDANQNMVVERLAGLNRQLLEAENDRKVAEAAYRAALAPGAAEALAGGDSNQQVTTAENKLADLRERRAQLLVGNTEEWPEVKEINQQIQVLEKYSKDARSRASSTVITNRATNYRQSVTREQALRTAFEQQRNETVEQNEAAINYRIIQQEVETNKTLLDGLLQRSKENDVVLAGLAGTPNNVRVVDYAIPPESPVGPRRMGIVAVAFVLSLSLGLGLALLFEHLDNTVNSTDDVEKVLHLPALAIIPSVGGLSRRRLLPGLGMFHKRNVDSGDRPELLITAEARSPRSSLGEAYRQLRTSVLLSTAGHAPKSLLVISSLPSEGKTTTSVNMAISLAQTGVRVLIVDADMRRPRLHDIFGLENQRGLSTILSRELSESEVLAIIEQHEETGVYVLPSGPIPPNPAELLGSDQMRQLISTLESNFAHAILDSPPISSVTDGVLLSSMVDGVLMVVSCGRSSREIVKRSRQMLRDVRAKILGVVINNVKFVRHDYY